jgi:hypothetical protein
MPNGPQSRIKLIITTALLLPIAAAFATQAPAAEISDGLSAIKKTQDTCTLEPPLPQGKWQAALVKNPKSGDEWHVWFGTSETEPQCGFYGAVVKVDGSYTSCRISSCREGVPSPLQLEGR